MEVPPRPSYLNRQLAGVAVTGAAAEIFASPWFTSPVMDSGAEPDQYASAEPELYMTPPSSDELSKSSLPVGVNVIQSFVDEARVIGIPEHDIQETMVGFGFYMRRTRQEPRHEVTVELVEHLAQSIWSNRERKAPLMNSAQAVDVMMQTSVFSKRPPNNEPTWQIVVQREQAVVERAFAEQNAPPPKLLARLLGRLVLWR